jgi:hypothetical protein
VHALELIVAVDEYMVVTRHSLEPQRGCLNNLVTHAIVVAWIARGTKCHNCMVEHMDTTQIPWTVVARVFMMSAVVQLLAQKAADELREIG